MRKWTTGFTLVEICMVMFILAVLAALLFPVLVAARQSAKQTAAISNLRQIGLAVALYRHDYEGEGGLGLPDYTLVDYFSAPKIFERGTGPLWMSPCGTHPDLLFLLPKAKTNLMYLASTQDDELFVRAYRDQGESTAYLFDLNCNPTNISVTEGEYVRKNALALRLDGSVISRQKLGVPYDPQEWK